MKTQIHTNNNQFFFFVFVFIFSCGLFIENDLCAKTPGMIQKFKEDILYIGQKKIRLKHYNKWKLSGYVGTVMLLIWKQDKKIHKKLGLQIKNSNRFFHMVNNIGLIYDRPGPPYFILGLTGLIYTSGKFLQNLKLEQTSRCMIRSVVITLVLNTTLKYLIGRTRPNVEGDPHLFKPINYKLNTDFTSMPSGHTASIFALIAVLCDQYPSWYIRLPAYTFACSVAFQRMYDDKHWASDLLLGGALGYLVGKAVSEREGQRIYIENSLSNPFDQFGYKIRFMIPL